MIGETRYIYSRAACPHVITGNFGDNMLKFSVLVGILLLVPGAASKPRTAWGKLADAVVQETIMSMDDEKLALGLKEVEPPEGLDVTDLDIDASSLLWKAVMESRRRHHANAPGNQRQDDKAVAPAAAAVPAQPEPQQPEQPRYQQAEEDEDEMYHRFPDPQQAQQQEEDSGPVEEQQEQGTWARIYDQAEVDMDDLYHADMGQPAAQGQGEEEAGQREQQQQQEQEGAWARLHKLEEDEDALYHADRGQSAAQGQGEEDAGQGQEQEQEEEVTWARVYEDEDEDDLYHADRGEVQVQTGVQLEMEDVRESGQRSRSEPPEDEDALYHR